MKYSSTINKINLNFKTPISKVMLVSFSCLSLLISYPKTSNAGFFSFYSDLKTENVYASIEAPVPTNTSNKIVLQAAVNADPNPYKDLDENPLISGNSLVAEIGPSGTAYEVEKEVINTQISLYVVREGDTLLDISYMFDVTPNTIIWANDLERNPVLKKGQKLVILPISGIKYTVKKGDTIKGVVLRHKSDLDEVLKYNDLTLSSVIAVGDVIIIPDAEPTIDRLAKKIIANVHDADGPFYPGYYIRPIDGGYKSQNLHGYNAVDIAASIGTPIKAAAAGTVISSVTGGWNGGYGNYVIISHSNGTQTLYAHNQKNFVKVGDRVEQDQIIARVGNTGKSTGPHVHFEIRGARNPF
jgi:LysM repeat protein